MTVTPIAPAPAGVPGAAPGAETGDGAEFGALVLGHLARLAGDGPGRQVGARAALTQPGTPGQVGSPDALAAESAATTPAAGAAGSALSALLAASAAQALCGTAGSGTPSAAATEETVEGEEGTEQPASGASATAPATAGAGGPSGALLAAVPSRLLPDAPGADLAARAPAETVPRSVDGTGTETAAATQATQPAQSPGAAQPSALSGLAGLSWQPVSAPAGVVPVEAGAALQAGQTADAGPLMDQVTPVVSRLVSAGEGSHKLVLRLHPADLGEIQVTVTVRGEEVDVTVAAGREARELLAEGSSQLRSLLESVGRTAGSVSFRDLPGTTPVAPATPTGQPGLTAGDHGSGAHDPYAGAHDTGSGTGSTGGRDGSGRAGVPRSDADPRSTDRPGSTAADPTPPATGGRTALDVRI